MLKAHIGLEADKVTCHMNLIYYFHKEKFHDGYVYIYPSRLSRKCCKLKVIYVKSYWSQKLDNSYKLDNYRIRCLINSCVANKDNKI